MQPILRRSGFEPFGSEKNLAPQAFTLLAKDFITQLFPTVIVFLPDASKYFPQPGIGKNFILLSFNIISCLFFWKLGYGYLKHWQFSL